MVADSGRGLTGGASEVVDAVEAVDDDETVRIGEKVDMAEPGRAGRFLVAAMTAFF